MKRIRLIIIKITIDNTDFSKNVSIINVDFVYLHHKKRKNMVTKELLRQVIYEQRELSNYLGVARDISEEQLSAPEVTVISGVRRCGKSVLLQQIKSRRKEQDYYMSFDDDRLLHLQWRISKRCVRFLPKISACNTRFIWMRYS